MEVAIPVVNPEAIALAEPVATEVRWHLTPEEGAASAGHPAKERGNRLRKGSAPLQSPLLSIACRR